MCSSMDIWTWSGPKIPNIPEKRPDFVFSPRDLFQQSFGLALVKMVHLQRGTVLL